MDKFCIVYKDWKPEEQKLREALTTLGNGYFATRGAAEENGNNEFNYPGTYLAGGYNRTESEIAGKPIVNEDFVNFPNWLCLSFRPEGRQWLNLEKVKVLDYQQRLEMKQGILEREFRIEDAEGRRTHIRSRRMVSMRDMHFAGIEWFFTPENWSGKVQIRTALDGTLINNNVERYSDLESRHLEPLTTKQVNEDSLLLLVRTRHSRIVMAQAARTRLYKEDKLIEPPRQLESEEGYIGQLISFDAEENQKYGIEKIVSLYTSRDYAISEPSIEACKDIERADRFEQLLLRHQQAWSRLWHRCDISLINGKETQELLRLHIFHVMQTASLNTIGLDVGIPSRGLHGEAYRGHIFWDELYVYPFLNLRFPQITRSMLLYRYRRLDEARNAASKEGYKGAMFPWQSGSNGREESQVIHLNPKSGNWIPDETHLQRHVNAAIAYNIWNYFLATDDQQFLSFYGAEMFLDIASYWASMATYNSERQRYEIHHVVGPDEYHTSYPDSDEKGLNNNAYTNVMVAWLLQKAVDLLELIEKSRKYELLQELDIDDKELSRWSEVSKKMYVPFIEGEEGVINQFEGYEQLEEFPWEEYRKKYENIQRLDRVLESEDDSPNHYKASKQADVLMLFYLFSFEDLKEIFQRLDYTFTFDMIGKNIEYYRRRTSHGSTLSRLVYSWILLRYDKKESWKNFETLLISDFKDIQGGTTPEGIHLGAMAGSLDLIQRCYAGLEVGDNALWLRPSLPKNLKKIKMRVRYRGHWIGLTINHDKLRIAFEEGWSKKVNIGVFDRLYIFEQGDVREFELVPANRED